MQANTATSERISAMETQIQSMSQASEQAAATNKTNGQKLARNMTRIQDQSVAEHISAAVTDMVTRLEVDAVRQEAREATQRLKTEYSRNRDADKKLQSVGDVTSAKMVKFEEDIGRVDLLVKREKERVDAMDEMVKMLAEQMSDEVCMYVCYVCLYIDSIYVYI